MKLKSRYQLTDQISEELLSFVFTGKDTHTSKNILVWKFKAEYCDANIIPKLIDAAEKLLPITHPNILKLLDYDYDGRFFYTIYNLPFSLISLETLIEEKKTGDKKLVNKILRDILAGLLELEENQLYYGNINLRNIYLSKNAELKLASAIIPEILITHHLNHLEGIEEGIFYPPEFYQKKSNSAQTLDIYAFGVLLYYITLGIWPYKTTSNQLGQKQQFLQTPKKPSAINPKISKKLSGIIEKCIAKTPASRYTSIAELKKAFKTDTQLPEIPDTEPTAEIEKEIAGEIKSKKGKNSLKTLKNSLVYAIPFIAIITLWWLYSTYLTAIPKTTVPPLKGLSIEAAKDILKDAKLKLKLSGTRVHPLIEEGHIVESKPPGGREVKQNRPVTVILSAGPPKSLVPNLYDKTLDQAKLILENSNLSIETIEDSYHYRVRKGRIYAQSVTPNQTVNESSTMNVSLSTGYPIEVTTGEATETKQGFFGTSYTSDILIKLWSFEDWPTQNITVQVTHKQQTRPIFNGELPGGIEMELRESLALPIQIEIISEGSLIYQKEIDIP